MPGIDYTRPEGVILDTNVVISGFLWRGPPYDILKAASILAFPSFTSETLLKELTRVLEAEKFVKPLSQSHFTPEELRGKYETFVNVIEPAVLDHVVVTADPNDDAVIAVAIASKSRWVVTGNGHLLKLKHSFGFVILTPAQFIASHPVR